MYEKKQIKEEVNQILLRENAKSIDYENLLIDSELDSLGYAILWLTLEEKYKCLNVEYVDAIDYKVYTLNDLIEKVNKCI